MEEWWANDDDFLGWGDDGNTLEEWWAKEEALGEKMVGKVSLVKVGLLPEAMVILVLDCNLEQEKDYKQAVLAPVCKLELEKACRLAALA